MTDGFGRLMERNEQLVRANVRLSRKLGRKCFWLNGVEAKLGMSVREFLELRPTRTDAERTALATALETHDARAEVNRLREALRERDHSSVPLAEHQRVQRAYEDHMERGVAIAKQHSELRTLTGCAEGEDLESRVRQLVRDAKTLGSCPFDRTEDGLIGGIRYKTQDEYLALLEEKSLLLQEKDADRRLQVSRREELDRVRKQRDEALIGKAAAEAQEQCLRERLATLDKNYGQVVNEREDALERHKQAHDRAMALHVVIGQAVEELRSVEDTESHKVACQRAKEAIHLLTRDELVAAPKQEAASPDWLDCDKERQSLRGKLRETAEDMRRWRELAGCLTGQSLEDRIEVLRSNAANWEAEAKEHNDVRNDVVERCHKIENRMSEAVRLLEPIRQDRAAGEAIAILTREEGDDPNIVREDGE